MGAFTQTLDGEALDAALLRLSQVRFLPGHDPRLESTITAIARDLKIPIRFVGVGEKMDDLIEFSPDDFVESLFAA